MADITLDLSCRPRRYVLVNTAEDAVLGNDEELLPEEAEQFNFRYAANGESLRWLPFEEMGKAA